MTTTRKPKANTADPAGKPPVARPGGTAPRPDPDADAAADPDRIAGLAGLGTLLTRPAFLTRSDWLEHIPFAFWLMAVHRPRTVVELGTADGASYFAFCQAAARLETEVDCLAVGAWEDGDADSPGPARLRQHNEAHYAAFSRLLGGDPEDIARHFGDTKVDLLHICGPAAPDRARACLDSWRPLLSPRAVVLLHNSEVRADGSGTAQLARSLGADHPSFRFRHGGGLAVIGVGADRPDALAQLFEAGTVPETRGALQALFGRLGRACADGYQAQDYQGLYYQALDRLGALPGASVLPALPPARGNGGGGGGGGPSPAEAQELESLRKEVAMLRAGSQARFEEIAALTQMIQALEAERQTQAPAAEWDGLKQSQSLAALRDQLVQKDRERADWEHMYRAILNSTSWKISRPVRWIGRLRRGGGGGPETLPPYRAPPDPRAIASAPIPAAAGGQDVDRLRQNLAALREEIARKDRELAEWERMYNAILGSTSWKISGPVRWLGKIRRR